MYFEIYQDVKKEWRWRLKAANHRIIADSGEGYVSKDNVLRAITLFKNGVSSAQVYSA